MHQSETFVYYLKEDYEIANAIIQKLKNKGISIKFNAEGFGISTIWTAISSNLNKYKNSVLLWSKDLANSWYKYPTRIGEIKNNSKIINCIIGDSKSESLQLTRNLFSPKSFVDLSSSEYLYNEQNFDDLVIKLNPPIPPIIETKQLSEVITGFLKKTYKSFYLKVVIENNSVFLKFVIICITLLFIFISFKIADQQEITDNKFWPYFFLLIGGFSVIFGILMWVASQILEFITVKKIINALKLRQLPGEEVNGNIN